MLSAPWRVPCRARRVWGGRRDSGSARRPQRHRAMVVDRRSLVARRHPGNLSIRLPVQDARDVVQMVQPALACSTGSACHSGTELPSHVLMNLGLSTEQARQVIRLGVGRFSTDADCRTGAAMLCRAVQTLHPRQGTEGPAYPESCDDTEVTVR